MRSDQGNVGGLACSDLICPLGICKLKKGPDYNSGNKIKKIKLKLKRYPQCNPSQRIIILNNMNITAVPIINLIDSQLIHNNGSPTTPPPYHYFLPLGLGLNRLASLASLASLAAPIALAKASPPHGQFCHPSNR